MKYNYKSVFCPASNILNNTLLLLITFVFIQFIHAQEGAVTSKYISADGKILYFIGDVVGSDLVDFFRNAPDTVETVSLYSNGGKADLGVALAKIIRQRGWTTYVDMNCQSACTMMFMGGVKRISAPGAYFELHYIRWYDNGRYNPGNPERLKAQKLFTQSYIDLGMDPELAYEIEKRDFKGRANEKPFSSIISSYDNDFI